MGTGDLLASRACFSVLSHSCENWQGMELVKWAGVTASRANVPTAVSRGLKGACAFLFCSQENGS